MIHALFFPNVHPAAFVIFTLVVGSLGVVARVCAQAPEEKAQEGCAVLIGTFIVSVAVFSDLVSAGFGVWPQDRRVFSTAVLAYDDDRKSTACSRAVTFQDPVVGEPGRYCAALLETYRAGEPVVVERASNAFGFGYALRRASHPAG